MAPSNSVTDYWFSHSLQSVVLFEDAPPPPPLHPLETTPPGVFSVAQLKKLRTQLSTVAPEGYMLTQTFIDTLYGFTDNAVSLYNNHAAITFYIT